MESRPKKLLDQVRDAIRVKHYARNTEQQNQALSALLFLYRNVLSQELGPVDSVRARSSQHVPTVLSRAEVILIKYMHPERSAAKSKDAGVE